MGTDVFKLVKDTPIFSDYIKSPEEIDSETLTKIRVVYTEAQEMKLHRQKLNGENLEEYEAYNTYVEECRAEGRLKKQEAQERLDRLVPHTIKEDNQERTVMVEGEE